MQSAIDGLRDKVNWKLRSLMRTHSFFKPAEMIHLYKARILSYIEYRAAAIYHGAATALARVDGVHNRLIASAGISKVDAILHFKLQIDECITASHTLRSDRPSIVPVIEMHKRQNVHNLQNVHNDWLVKNLPPNYETN